MAEIQDFEDDTSGQLDEFDAVEQKSAEQKPEEEKKIESVLPEKYRGKSVEEVIRMHQEAEKLIDRHTHEVGEVRKLADELIKSQLSSKAKEVEKAPEVDFFENPQEAIRQQIENNPRLQAAEAYAIEARQQQAKQEFFRRHPDAGSILSETGFQEWVKASRVRSQLFDLANNYDIDAGDELLSTYKELKSVRQQKTVVADTAVRNQSMKAASVETGGSGESSQKIYRRADLIRLNMRDPAKYAAMSEDIMRAYAEGRVK